MIGAVKGHVQGGLDDDELRRIAVEYGSGRMSSSEIKSKMIEVVTAFLAEHQVERTLAVAAAAALPAGHENAHAGAPARPEAKTAIAWTRPWGNKS